MKQPDSLRAYREKRDFSKTREPPGAARTAADQHLTHPARLRFVVQKHWASRLHYDFRLEIDGTLKSWAVPKGPSLDPAIKRMAVHVEDHPIEYGSFEGPIPKGEYGAGKVIIWDHGEWEPDHAPGPAYSAGKLKFTLKGNKLQGRWALIRTRDTHWLLIKEQDPYARPEEEYRITDALPDSVISMTETGLSEPPAELTPQLATRVSAPPSSSGWAYELKYDGYRLLTHIANGRARLLTRSGHDWTHRLPSLAQALQTQALPDGWYDGEIVALNTEGKPDFHALQNAFEQGVRHHAELVYFLFDLLWMGQRDLRPLPFQERRHILTSLLNNIDHPMLRISDVFDVPAQSMLQSACELGLEGVIGKRLDSPYTAGRSGNWIKLKCAERQEFVVGGYTDPQGGRPGLGALLLGYYNDKGQLRYAGKVGSGFNDIALATLHQRLSDLKQPHPSFKDPPRGKGLHWVQPRTAVEVSFSQWTTSGRVRHAVFLGVRDDKATTLMKKEHAITITSADRLVDSKSRTQKGDVAAYYERIAPLILPHLQDRPVSLLRAPDGLKGELFFQKHMKTERFPGLMELDPDLDPGHEPLVVLRDATGLPQAAQMNVIEFHTWNAIRSRLDRPDRITFDLDPGKGIQWVSMQEAAMLLRHFLEELGLPCFIKTSGGKGLHAVVPIQRRYDWDTAKGFSKAVVQHMADVLPQRFSAKSGPRNRVGKIFIDYLRNGFGATTVSAWSLRARPGMGVSVPIAWEEVETIASGDHWTIQNIDTRLPVGNTPWATYADSAIALGPAMKRLGYKPL